MRRRARPPVILLKTSILITAVLVLSGLLAPAPSGAGGSAPALSIASATSVAAANGARTLVVSGSFNFDDLVQFAFPAGVIVTQGSRFVRYDVSGAIVEGTSSLVADGVADTEVPSLVAARGAAVAPASIVQLRQQRFMVVLPADFDAGLCSVILYAVLESDPFVSNTVQVNLP